MSTIKFSVLMSVYAGDDPEHLKTALKSIENQTIKPAEVVIVQDGSIGCVLETVIADFTKSIDSKTKLIKLDSNRGLGEALRTGIQQCSHELVARMDSDDICKTDRFEKQVSVMYDREDIDVLGSYIAEFSGEHQEQERIRKVPLKHEEIEQKLKMKCPMNHPSVVLRKSSVIQAGNYSQMEKLQDYELWCRMISKGYRFANLPDVLLLFRADDVSQRRGGLTNIKNEIRLQAALYNYGTTTRSRALFNTSVRVTARIMPNLIRERIINLFLRSS